MTDPAPRSLVVVSGGLNQPSSTRLLADRLAAAVEGSLEAAGIAAETQVIELRGHAHDLANNLLTGFPSPALRAAIETVLGADGLIAVSPIFNASYSGLFKLFFDVIEKDGLAAKPTLIAATGGTPRHSLAIEHALRPLFAYLNAAVVATGVYASAEDWGAAGASPEVGLVERIDRAAGELAAAVVARPNRSRPDAFEAPVPFEAAMRAAGVPDRPDGQPL